MGVNRFLSLFPLLLPPRPLSIPFTPPSPPCRYPLPPFPPRIKHTASFITAPRPFSPFANRTSSHFSSHCIASLIYHSLSFIRVALLPPYPSLCSLRRPLVRFFSSISNLLRSPFSLPINSFHALLCRTSTSWRCSALRLVKTSEVLFQLDFGFLPPFLPSLYLYSSHPSPAFEHPSHRPATSIQHGGQYGTLVHPLLPSPSPPLRQVGR